MKSIYKILRFILNHPVASKNKFRGVYNFFSWQFKMRLRNEPQIFEWIGGAKLYIKRGMTGATGNIYTGLHEFEDMAFLLHYLKEGDMFFDVGANIGSYSILASSCKKAFVNTFEPVPSTFQYLERNVHLNKVEDLVRTFNVGVSDVAGKILFTNGLDTINHAVLQIEEGTADCIEVEVVPLDSFYPQSQPNLMKIDVEGFEFQALNGALKLLGAETLDGIIIELNGTGKRYGHSDETVHKLLGKNGYQPYSYDPFNRKITKRNKPKENENTLYLKETNILRIKERISKAAPFEVLNVKV